MKKSVIIAATTVTAANVKNTAFAPYLISIAAIGGPIATPSRRELLYIDVIVPRCSFSIPSVISASRLGSTAPTPVPAIDRAIISIIRPLENPSQKRDTEDIQLPINIIHFMRILCCPIFFPDIKEVRQRKSKGIATISPLFIPFILYSSSSVDEK
mgnify:CR=1 FL=1